MSMMEMTLEQQQALILQAQQAQRLEEENKTLRALVNTAAIATGDKDKAKLGTPADFNGNLHTDVLTWLGSMEVYLTESHTPPVRWPNVASTYLKGNASLWYQAIPREEKGSMTWEAFRVGLIARFRPVDNNQV